MNDNKDFKHINDQDDLDYLQERIQNGPLFAFMFKFEKREYFIHVLNLLNIDQEEFDKKYHFYDNKRNIHISESEFGYVWISTLGLIAKGKPTSNKYVNACVNQYTVINLLFEKAIEISESDSVYDVDSYNFGYLSELTTALFHNVLFYIEVFFKAYLSLCGVAVPYGHELSKLFPVVVDTMFEKKHSNTLFHANIVSGFEEIIKYVSSIPGGFKEHFVKYDDNSEDSTVIQFNPDSLKRISDVINMSNDFINSYYYDQDDAMFIKPGLFERLLDKAETESEKQRINDNYGHMKNGFQ